MEKITLNETHKEQLFTIPLLRDMPSLLQVTFFDYLDTATYAVRAGEIAIAQGIPCQHLYVLLDGLLNVEIIDGLGNRVQIEHIEAPRSFATPHLFAPDSRMPATFTALKDSVLFTATKESTFRLLNENPELLKSFLSVVGNCNYNTVSRFNALLCSTEKE
ncbi:MAG: cyclic nucleotide-binding domain-containing protein [Mediterranea sp.]|jgi:CRP-like cAMP-binding protein|nr:cyclic nucleotide-binding domain-containing protein [Mediterranea sp.]